MGKARNLRRPAALVVVVALMALAACGGGESGDGDSSGAKEIVVSQGTDPRTLDPLESTFTFDQNVYGQVVETLLVFSPDAKEVRPNLATSVEPVDDTTWRIELEKDVKFHNGEVLDAAAVKYSLEKLVASKAYAVFNPSVIKEVSVDGEAVIVTTTKPAPSLPILLARAAWIYPPKYTEEAGADFASSPVGTGPFKFESWVKDDRIELSAFDDYWGGRSSIDRVIFRPIPDASARIAALEAGEVDLINDLPMDQIKRVDGHDGLTVTSAHGLRPFLLYLNYLDGKTPLADKRVRQALNYAIDKEGIVESLFQGYGKPLLGQPMPEEYFGSNPDLQPYPYDPDKARSLLKEAGVADSLELKVDCPQGRFILDSSACETIVSQLVEAGVKAKVNIMEPGAFATAMGATELGPAFYAGFLTPPDAYFYYAIAGPGSAYRYFQDNPEFDALVARGDAELDSDKRASYYREAAEIIHDDPYAIYLWTVDAVYGVSDRVENWTANSDESLTLRGVTLG